MELPGWRWTYKNPPWFTEMKVKESCQFIFALWELGYTKLFKYIFLLNLEATGINFLRWNPQLTVLGWKLLGSRASGKRRPLICPSGSRSQLPFPSMWQLGPWPRNPYSCPLWISCYFFLPKAVNISKNRCICFLYFFCNDNDSFICLFMYLLILREDKESIRTSKIKPHIWQFL